jgi:bacillithiol system protein YtxJ
MSAEFSPITDAEGLEALVGAAVDRPAVLFLDDPICAASWRAQEQVSILPIPIAYVDVSEHPEMAQIIEQRTGVRHESPQVILVRGGRGIWSASHSRITANAVAQALLDHRYPPAEG